MKWYCLAIPVFLTATECNYIFDRYPTKSSTPHTLFKMGDALELEDGSIWSVSIYDIPVALNWHVDDSIAVTQNTRWFTEYPYRLVNQENGTTVESNLIKGSALTIAKIGDTITLSDGTKWKTDSKLEQVGDSVTIGDNADLDPNWDKIFILDKKFVRVKKL